MRRILRPDEIDEIERELLKLLDMHVKGVRGHIGQDPNRNDFFKLCRRAYKGGAMKIGKVPSLTTDALRDSLEEMWLDNLDKEDRPQAKEILDDLLRRWREWVYVLDRL